MRQVEKSNTLLQRERGKRETRKEGSRIKYNRSSREGEEQREK